MAARKLEPTEEVMLTPLGERKAGNFNPYYGLVVLDNMDPDPACRKVLVLWEDGMERLHFRDNLIAWADMPPEARP